MLHSPSSAILILILRTGYFVEGEWGSSKNTGEECVESGADCSSFLLVINLTQFVCIIAFFLWKENIEREGYVFHPNNVLYFCLKHYFLSTQACLYFQQAYWNISTKMPYLWERWKKIFFVNPINSMQLVYVRSASNFIFIVHYWFWWLF